MAFSEHNGLCPSGYVWPHTCVQGSGFALGKEDFVVFCSHPQSPKPVWEPGSRFLEHVIRGGAGVLDPAGLTQERTPGKRRRRGLATTTHGVGKWKAMSAQR